MPSALKVQRGNNNRDRKEPQVTGTLYLPQTATSEAYLAPVYSGESDLEEHRTRNSLAELVKSAFNSLRVSPYELLYFL